MRMTGSKTPEVLNMNSPECSEGVPFGAIHVQRFQRFEPIIRITYDWLSFLLITPALSLRATIIFCC